MMLHPHWLTKKSVRRRRKQRSTPEPTWARELIEKTNPAFLRSLFDGVTEKTLKDIAEQKTYRFGDTGNITIPKRPGT